MTDESNLIPTLCVLIELHTAPPFVIFHPSSHSFCSTASLTTTFFRPTLFLHSTLLSAVTMVVKTYFDVSWEGPELDASGRPGQVKREFDQFSPLPSWRILPRRHRPMPGNRHVFVKHIANVALCRAKWPHQVQPLSTSCHRPSDEK